jgi:predicted ester cyclase
VYLGNGDVGGGQVLEGLFARIAQGLPDISLEIDKVIFSGDRVVVLFTMSGTHLGPIGVWPASGRTLPSTGALIARANRQSQASELWAYVAPGYAITLPPTGTR